MTRFLTIPLAFLIAIPLVADEPNEKAKSQPAAAQTQSTTDAPADSPMVQAMKRANRLGRKPAARVITNESLRSSKGHVTTTTVQYPVNIPEPELTPAALAAQNARREKEEQAKAREIGAAKDKQAAEERMKRLAQTAERAEEGLYEGLDDDPAQTERAAEEAREKPPQD